jgi:hypothetical protein
VNTATIAPASDGPLTQEQRHELALANQRAKKIRKAAGVAAFNGWATGIFAALSALVVLCGFSIDGFLITVGLTVIAYNEFQGRKRLLQFDPSASALLGWNQVGLMTLIVVYCLWSIYAGFTRPSSLVAENPELAEALGSSEHYNEVLKGLTVIFYGAVIVLSAFFQGLNALYYFSRRKYIEAYVRETPPWVVEIQHIVTPG